MVEERHVDRETQGHSRRRRHEHIEREARRDADEVAVRQDEQHVDICGSRSVEVGLERVRLAGGEALLVQERVHEARGRIEEARPVDVVRARRASAPAPVGEGTHEGIVRLRAGHTDG